MPVTLTQIDVDATASTLIRKGLGIVASDAGIAGLNNVAGAESQWWPWDGSNFGTRTTANSTPTLVDNAISVNNAGTVVAIADTLGGGIIRAFSIAAGPTLGALLSTSAAMAGGNCAGMAWAPDDSVLAVAWTNSPSVQAMSWNGSAFGAVVSATAPSVAPSAATAGRAIAFSPDGTAIAAAIGVGDIAVYPWNGAAFGTKSEPTGAKTFTTGSGSIGVDFNPDGDQITLAGDNAPFVAVYSWNGTTVGTTRIAVPTMVAAGGGVGSGALFDRNGEYIFVGGSTMDQGETLYVYEWDGANFGARTDPDISPGPLSGFLLTTDNTTLFFLDSVADIRAYATGLVLVTTSGTAGGTLTGSVPEGTIRGAGGTVTVTINGDTFIADLSGVVQDIVDGLVGSGAGGREWNGTDKPGATVDRVSDTEITVTIPPLPGYDTSAGETITVTIPGSALTGGAPIVLTPDPAFTITAGPEPAAGGPQPWQSTEREALRVLATAQGTEVRRGVQAVERTLQELLAEITGDAPAGPFPTDREKLYDAIFEALGAARVRNVKETYILDAIERFLP